VSAIFCSGNKETGRLLAAKCLLSWVHIKLDTSQAGYFSSWALTKTKGVLPTQEERLSSL
jgi:hypothetical protein